MNEGIQQHYTRPDLGNIILAALEQAGKDLNKLTPEDLAPIDEFHIRGREATLELARAAEIDILAGPSRPVQYPLPWARTPDTNFLVTPDQLRKLLNEANFRIASWSDSTDAARTWVVPVTEKIRKEGPPPPGFHVLLGPDFQIKARNQLRSLEEGRIVLAQVIAKK